MAAHRGYTIFSKGQFLEQSQKQWGEKYVFSYACILLLTEKKKDIWLRPVTKKSWYQQKIQKPNLQYQHATKKIRYHSDRGPTYIPTMHKNPYKHRFIAGSSKCSTKPLSILLTKLLTHIKQGLQKYCETAYSRSGVNQMWIFKNSKELLDHLKSPNINLIRNIKSFDFSTLYTTIPHHKLKSRLATIKRNAFLHKNGNRRYN